LADQNALPEIEHLVYIGVAPRQVYETLTTGEGWDGWFTDGTEVNAAPEGQIRLRWRDFGAGHWTTEDGGPVLDALPDERFVFQWSPGERPTTVSFTLEPLGPGTLVKLTESGYSASERDARAHVGCAVGWGEALTLLKFYLEHGLTYGRVPRS
jgi:uncharacterized protein YndB with AHSA1/START domain